MFSQSRRLYHILKVSSYRGFSFRWIPCIEFTLYCVIWTLLCYTDKYNNKINITLQHILCGILIREWSHVRSARLSLLLWNFQRDREREGERRSKVHRERETAGRDDKFEERVLLCCVFCVLFRNVLTWLAICRVSDTLYSVIQPVRQPIQQFSQSVIRSVSQSVCVMFGIQCDVWEIKKKEFV